MVTRAPHLEGAHPSSALLPVGPGPSVSSGAAQVPMSSRATGCGVNGAVARGAERRVVAAVAAHHTFIWRTLRRFGVAEENADDAAQQVFCVFARRLADVPREKEKTFLCGVAVRVAQGVRRERTRHPLDFDDAALEAARCVAPLPDEELADRRARAVLDDLLDALPPDQRAVFVLHEIEELTMAEIAVALSLPPGTVASRLRRARELFDSLAARVRAGVPA